MYKEPIEVVPGSGNVFRDFDLPNPDLEQLKSILGARIIGVIEEKHLSVRKAQQITGIAAADSSRIRRASFGRFTIDRLMAILNRLGQKVEVSVNVHPRAQSHELGDKPMSEASMYRVIAGYVAKLPGAVKEGARLYSPFPAGDHCYPASGCRRRYPKGSGAARSPSHHHHPDLRQTPAHEEPGEQAQVNYGQLCVWIGE